MSKGRAIRCYDYVNHPYEQVRNALGEDALSVFQMATKSAVSRARSVAAELRVDIGGVTVGADIRISIKKIERTTAGAAVQPATHIHLEWEAATLPKLFPLMQAELSIYPLTAGETQLDFGGNYEPPLGFLGQAVNALAGYRLAEVTVHRFVSDVAAHLRENLS